MFCAYEASAASEIPSADATDSEGALSDVTAVGALTEPPMQVAVDRRGMNNDYSKTWAQIHTRARRNSLTPFRRRARIRRVARLLRRVALLLIVLALLAVITFRLMTCIKTPITGLSPIAPLNILYQMSSVRSIQSLQLM